MRRTMRMTKDVFDEYGNYKYPDYSNSQYTNYATATGGKMGITIEEIIEELESTKDYPASDPASDEALDGAIDTIRKYQKIQEIVSDFREYQKGISYGFGGATYMQMVSEVVEDGNDD